MGMGCNIQEIIRAAKDKNIVLLSATTHNGDEAWYYVLSDERKIPILKRLISTGDGIDIANYGTILASGWGDTPPKYVKEKMRREGIDFDGTEYSNQPNSPDMKYYVQAVDFQNRAFYAYMVVPGFLSKEFETVLAAGQMNLNNYGEIMIMEFGHPSEETIKEMEADGYTHNISAMASEQLVDA